MPDTRRPRISALIPVSERHADLREAFRIYARELARRGSFEVVIALDAGFRGGARQAAALCDAHPGVVRVVALPRRCGESALLRAGARAARGDVVVTLPAYLQVDPAAIGALVDAVERDGADLACAVREPRADARVNRLQSRAFHAIVGALAGARFRDLSCGARALRRGVLERLAPRGDLHRFLPLLALAAGYRVLELPVAQHPADTARRVRAPGVYLRRALDLAGAAFLFRFREKPLRFFGLAAAALGAAGAGAWALGAPAAAAVVLGALAAQVLGLGLVAEVIVHGELRRRAGEAPAPAAAEVA